MKSTCTTTFPALLALALALALGAPACEESAPAEGDATESSEGSGAGAGSDVAEPAPEVFETQGTCVVTEECGPGLFCDKRKGGCVQCFTNAHCPDGQFCHRGACIEDNACESDDECLLSVCGPLSKCVECNETADCPQDGWVCVAQACRPPYGGCEDQQDCTSVGAVCDVAAGVCTGCEGESGCGQFEACDEATKECLPDICPPSNAFCFGDVVKICREDGKGYYDVACPDGQTCSEGECVFEDCDEPGILSCKKYKVTECTPQGKIVSKACPPGAECGDGECVPMRHRVLTVFDTSGSMGWFPGTSTWPDMCPAPYPGEDCFGPYPNCEDPANPITKLSFAKKAFTAFFEEDNEDVVFGLQRFPQRTADLNGSCLGGYYTPTEQMTGDDGDYTTGLAEDAWFEDNLGEVILESFPIKGGPTNVFSVRRWMDFKEEQLISEDKCTKPEDCPQGICKGLAGQVKTCTYFTNPEIWSEGWTPLGRSLYYAAEYMRRHVVVDGKPCGKDLDCGSPGYFCNAAGKCFDPLRECRLNAVILFTDGAETEYPFPTQYFNPQVQAKRMRYGLGCEVDEDCSGLDFCYSDQNDPNLPDLSLFGCHPARCESGSCTNDVIEFHSTAEVDYSTSGVADRLTDYNGNPFNVIVNVVDASGEDPEQGADIYNQNKLIALYGGGTYVQVDIEDIPDFVAKIRDTVDAKQTFTECAKALGQVIK